MTLYKGSTPIAGLQKNTIVTGFNTFDCKLSDHIINDIQWLRADTFSWQSGNVYVTAYNKLVSEYSTGTTETVGGITYKRTTNGFKIADASQETAINNKYNSDGIAWFYILDTTNTQFKLPRTKFGFEGLRTNVGDDIAESLPNITGYIDGIANINPSSVSGAFTSSHTVSGDINTTSSATYKRTQYTFNANNSSSTYQDNAPVQERATQMYLYFYVGEYSRTALEQTAGITTEQLNAKLDIPTRYVVAKSSKSILPSWWVEYNDGWCEQGGQIVYSSSYNGDQSISFAKTFSDTTYSISTSKRCNTSWENTVYATKVRTWTTSSMVVTVNIDNSGVLDWQASGYIS